MTNDTLNRLVRRITVLEPDGSGGYRAVTVFERDAKKRKGRRIFKPLERAARYAAEAQSRSAGEYLDRHARSNTRRRDGWLRDLGNNLFRASRKGAKAIKVNRIYAG
jgi:hypothetical protein